MDQTGCNSKPPDLMADKVNLPTRFREDPLFQLLPEWWHASEVSAVISRMQKDWPWHRYYSPEQIHFTILGLGAKEFWQGKSDALKSILNKIARKHTSIQLRISGLNVLNDALVAQVIDPARQLLHLTEDLTAMCKEHVGRSDFSAGLHQELWWVTLERLGAPVSNEELSFIACYRTAEFGGVDMYEISLVETNKTFDLSRTRAIYQATLCE